MVLALLVLAGSQTGTRVLHQSRTAKLEVRVVLPRLGKSPHERSAKLAMEKYCRAEIARIRSHATDPENGGATFPFSLDIQPTSVYRTGKLVSVALEAATFSGGAHGMVNYRTFNYGLVSGKPKALTLAAFFPRRRDYVDRVSFALMNQLRGMENADWVQNGQIRELDANQLRNFVVRPGSRFRFYFPPYELGSYASGPFELELKMSEVGATISL